MVIPCLWVQTQILFTYINYPFRSTGSNGDPEMIATDKLFWSTANGLVRAHQNDLTKPLIGPIIQS